MLPGPSQNSSNNNSNCISSYNNCEAVSLSKRVLPQIYNGYRNFSHVPKPLHPPKSTEQNSFVSKLHQMLSDATFKHIIAWLPHGRSWHILQPDLLQRDILPLFFRQKNDHPSLSYFMRQVKCWGFHRVRTPSVDTDSYFHECFLRGMPHLCTHVRRQDRGRPSQEQYCQNFTNPDFDAISQDHPLPPLHQETSNHQYLLPSSQSQSLRATRGEIAMSPSTRNEVESDSNHHPDINPTHDSNSTISSQIIETCRRTQNSIHGDDSQISEAREHRKRMRMDLELEAYNEMRIKDLERHILFYRRLENQRNRHHFHFDHHHLQMDH